MVMAMKELGQAFGNDWARALAAFSEVSQEKTTKEVAIQLEAWIMTERCTLTIETAEKLIQVPLTRRDCLRGLRISIH